MEGQGGEELTNNFYVPFSGMVHTRKVNDDRRKVKTRESRSVQTRMYS
jgi:hypothetical protein